LIHDDLPAMDDDTVRRGRSTAHVVYGDAVAILAGDALLTHAFGVLARPESAETPAGQARRLRAMARLADAAGAAGMVGGQVLDIGATDDRGSGRATPDIGHAALRDIHERKTGALIRAAAAMGAILAGGDDETLAAIDAYSTQLGLAFQIVDDILDVEGTTTKLGKTVGKDAVAGKPTYPALHGLTRSRALASEAVAAAADALARAKLGGRLSEIADWVISRRH
jgi:geranylgeranyl pyrophosphate synthase